MGRHTLLSPRGLFALCLLPAGGWLAMATSEPTFVATGTLWIDPEGGAPGVDEGSAWVELVRTDELASTADAVMGRLVTTTADLKRAPLEETVVILEDQLGVIEAELTRREVELDAFRASTASRQTSSEVAAARLEARLVRALSSSEALYLEVRGRLEGARMARASSIPDVRILELPTVEEVTGRSPAARGLLIALALGTAAPAFLVVPMAGFSVGGLQATGSIWTHLVPLAAVACRALLALLTTAFLR